MTSARRPVRISPSRMDDWVFIKSDTGRNFWISGLYHRPVFEGTRRFGNWICFRPLVKGGKKTPTQLDPLERANLNHWTTAVRRSSKLLYYWRSTANQFILASSPLRLNSRFFSPN
jgi:hypothetical protein